MYVNDQWFDNKRLQVTEEIKKALSRQTCVAGLAVAGFAALVMLTPTVVASVAFSWSIQNRPWIVDYLRMVLRL